MIRHSPPEASEAKASPSSVARAARSIGASGSVARTTSVSPAARLGERPAGVEEREWARQPAGVEGSYDQGMIAAFLESGDLQRLYTGLSLLVSAAAEGRPARALLGFGALEPVLDERLLARALRPDAAPDVSEPVARRSPAR